MPRVPMSLAPTRRGRGKPAWGRSCGILRLAHSNVLVEVSTSPQWLTCDDVRCYYSPNMSRASEDEDQHRASLARQLDSNSGRAHCDPPSCGPARILMGGVRGTRTVAPCIRAGLRAYVHDAMATNHTVLSTATRITHSHQLRERDSSKFLPCSM